MFRTRKDVERHVSDVLSKIDNENEKLLRGFTFARLFYQVKDYDSAKKYLLGFLSVRDHHAASHKLLGQLYEVTFHLESALQSYKRSLEIDPQQSDIVLKICELYCKLPVDHETARYWADRAEQLFPHNEIVFKLRECLVSSEGEPDRKELENLIATELAAQPKNVDLRIKLLKLYLDTERVKEAYDHATTIESKRLFPYSITWYYMLCDIFEAYHEEFASDIDCSFYMQCLSALDNLIYLTLAEPHTLMLESSKKASSLNDTAALLVWFDQLLNKAVAKDNKEGCWIYFIHHMKAQLYFHMVSLLMKRVKMDQINRKEALRFSSGLATVCYTFKPVNLLQKVWFSEMEDNQKLFTNFSQRAALRISFIGHILNSLCKEDKNTWLQKIKQEICIPQVKERIYNRIFSSVLPKDKLLSSYFLTDTTFEQAALELPTEVSLREYDKSAYELCPDSLHYLVWFELHRSDENCKLQDYLKNTFSNLQYNNTNLSRGSCESLCVLDLESFLYASVYQSRIYIEKRNETFNSRNSDSPLIYPPDITEPLCSKAQANWWKAAYGLYSCNVNREKLGEQRRSLQHGLEVIRGIGNHGMEVQLVVHLARSFSRKADALNDEKSTDKNKSKVVFDNDDGLYFRASHYWNIALGMLQKLADGQSPKIAKDPMFVGCMKSLSKKEINDLQEEGQLFLAVKCMNTDKLNEAAELLSKLSSAYASYYLSLTLKRLASLEQNLNTKSILLNKAKSALHDTLDRIKDDKCHPLNNELHIELEDVETELANHMNNTAESNFEDVDETDAYNGSSLHNNSLYYSLALEKASNYSTPKPAAKFMTSKVKLETSSSSTQHFEPSPERLDAQIRALTLHHDTLQKSFIELQVKQLEQQQMHLETNKALVDALQKNTVVVEQLKKQLEELSLSNVKSSQKTVPKKAGFPRVQGDEDDLYDPNNLLDYYGEDAAEDYRTGYEASSRIIHDPTVVPAGPPPLNYVMSPGLPHGPPPPLNHYSYQYPHPAVLPGHPAPPAVERPYYAAPGQGLPFSEGQQLPQFHFHVASSAVKPPPPPVMSSTLPPPPTLPVPPALPPLNVPIPPISMASAAVPLPPAPWAKPASVPHAFQIPTTSMFPPATVSDSVHATATTATVVTSSSPVAATHSQLKNLLETPVSKPISFGQPSTLPTSSVPSATSPSLFSGLVKTPEKSLERSRCESESAASEVDGHDLEKEVMGDFKPVIPLPAEVVVETGEENEKVLFEDRAKLFRFIDQEWKERGIGTVKILHHEETGRVRLLMRRDQVLKVCANHCITPTMEIHAMKNSDKAWTWIAQDFADEELRPEHFCIRFKTPEIAASFKNAFDKAISIVKEAEKKKMSSPKTAATSAPSVQNSFGSMFLPKTGSWECTACYVNNEASANICIACNSKRPGTETATTISSSSPSPFAFNFNTTVSSSDSSKNVFGGFTFSSSPLIKDSSVPETPEREILVVSTKAKNGPQVTKVTTAEKPSPFTGFSFTSPTATVTQTSTNGASCNDGSKTGTFSGFPSGTPTQSKPASESTPKTNFFSGFSFKSSSLSSGTTTANTSTSITSSQPITNSAFGFSKTASETGDVVKNLASATSPGSLFIHVSSDGRRVSTEGAPEEFIPTAEFKPVVPLPALVDLKTGEEEEEKLFGERAKLFRYDTESKEWKERGIGELKILHLKEANKYRILMRRDQVLKICANHYIFPDMKLSPLSNSDRAWTWFAQDYSDGDLANAKLAAKFKTPEIAQEFLKTFEKCVNNLKADDKKEDTESYPCANNKSAFDELLQSKADSFFCPKCKKCNMNSSFCALCQTSKPITTQLNAISDQKPLSELFKPPTDSWECTACYVRNDTADAVCISCGCPNYKSNDSLEKDDKENSTAVNQVSNKPLSELFKPQAGSWECEVCLVRNASDAIKCASCETSKPGTAAVFDSTSKPFSSGFQFGASSTSDVAQKFSFGAPKAGGDFLFGKKPTTQPTTFSFGLSSLSEKKGEPFGFTPTFSANSSSLLPLPSMFGGTTQKTDLSNIFGNTQKSDSQVSSSQPSNTSVSSIFGGSKLSEAGSPAFETGSQRTESSSQNNDGNVSSSTSAFSSQSVFNFGSSSNPELSEFRFGSPQKYEFNFSGVRPRSPPKAPKSPKSPATPSDAEDEEENESFDADIYFQPVIPLPPKVDVVTGEENEKVLFCHRAKLFRFVSGEWKERGIGDIKILHDEVGRKIRLLMRREQVLKVCLNHYITKDMTFDERNDKTLSWAATDFSENEPSPELFAVRFKTTEIAADFKKAIGDALKLIDKPVTAVDINKAASTFSFKSDAPKQDSSFFSFGSLSSRFGTSAQKPVFGDWRNPQSAGVGNDSSFFSSSSNTPTGSSFFETLDQEIEVVYEAKPTPEELALAKKYLLPSTFFLYKNKPNCPGCIGCDDIIPEWKTASDENVNVSSTENKSSPPTAPEEHTSEDGTPILGAKSSMSFADIASQSSLGASSSFKSKVLAGAGTPVFAKLNKSTEGEGDDDQVEESPDVHFQPVIPLPDLITVKTGEEDETPIFVHRAKLFRYDTATKQWKERGIGDLKILKHNEKLRFRIILRREQVYKIACNHNISEKMELSPLSTSDKAVCWTAVDYSEAQPEAVQLAVRFKYPQQLEEFKQRFNECKQILRNAKDVPAAELDVENSKAPLSTLAEASDAENPKPALLTQAKASDVENPEPALSTLAEASDVKNPELTLLTPAKASNVENPESTPTLVEQPIDKEADNLGKEIDEIDEESDEDELICEKEVNFQIADEVDEFKNVGTGRLQIYYDSNVFGYHIYMISDLNETTMCDTLIGFQTSPLVEGRSVSWSATDICVDPPRRRRFRAQFNSDSDLEEFVTHFNEGKEIAMQSSISDGIDIDFLGAGQ